MRVRYDGADAKQAQGRCRRSKLDPVCCDHHEGQGMCFCSALQWDFFMHTLLLIQGLFGDRGEKADGV